MGAARTTVQRAIDPLRRPAFRWYFAARLTSVVGAATAPLALAFAVLDLTDDPGALGAVLASATLPMLGFLLVGGVLADRLPRTALMQVAHVVQGAAQATAATLVVTGRAEVWHLAALGAVGGTATAAALPALRSVVPQLVPRAQLQEANLLLSVTRGAVAVAGPSLAALLVVTTGPGWALAVDAVAALLAAALLTRVPLPAVVHDRAAARGVRGVLGELAAGRRELAHLRWFWTVVGVFAVLNAVQALTWTTLGPPLALRTVGERGWGLALSALALGLLLGAVALLGVRLRRPLLVGMLAIAVTGLPILALGADPRVVPLVATAFLAGVGVEVYTLGWHLALQENVPEQLLSRAYSWDQLGSYAAIPAGQLLAGPLASTFGVRPTIVAGGVLYVVLALAVLGSREVRTLQRAPADPAPDPTPDDPAPGVTLPAAPGTTAAPAS
ncbi:MFS transporter [Nocardioides perillae]|uniref:MFS family permease n=1 Tax=Nocardioides perillae TaxID=1119534 RepID=A0A7Y9RZ34_9ACTN|nr:MFS transporter [Nocardioides perillae]NYG56600.1 MFS family permease [Nocardioides perillae]